MAITECFALPIVLGHSGGAVPDFAPGSLFVGGQKRAADHQRTLRRNHHIRLPTECKALRKKAFNRGEMV